MNWFGLEMENSAMIMIALVVVVTVTLTGCVKITGMDGEEVIIVASETGLAIIENAEDSAYPALLEAMVKGSIYESGEAVSVFATCLDGNDKPVNNTAAYLSSWYPNGSIDILNYSMVEIQQGYYVYQGPMNSVGGTYLTQARCEITGSSPLIEAFAFGEWQNPAWVAKINETFVETQNLSIQIGQLQANITDGFEITWSSLETINSTVINYGDNLTTLITEVGQIANDSVDRNDSYIVELLLQLNDSIIFGSAGPNATGNTVNWTEDAEYPYFYKEWEIKVEAFDPVTGKGLKYPDVLCNIQTTLNGASVPMTPKGNKFKYEEFINQIGDFSWNVSCEFA